MESVLAKVRHTTVALRGEPEQERRPYSDHYSGVKSWRKISDFVRGGGPREERSPGPMTGVSAVAVDSLQRLTEHTFD